MDKWMKNNNFNKILALAFGIMLWAMVHVDTAPVSQTTVSTQTKIIENVKINVSGFDEDKYVMDMDVDSVRMEVQGKRSDITYKVSDAYEVTLDLSDIQPGDTTLPLQYKLPKGVELVRMTPEEVNVHVELRNTKSFPITMITKGKPADGYQLGTPVLQPVGTAEVTLAASELSKVAKVQGTIELDGESDTFKENKMKLYAYDSSGNEIPNAVIEPSSVSVEIPITLPFKSLPLEIGYTGQLPDSLVLSRVTPELEAIVVYGQKDVLTALSSYEATIDLSSIDAAGTVQLKAELKPSAGIEKIEPATVNVTVSTSKIAERTIEGIPIKLQGVSGGLEAVITTPESKAITLTLAGAPTLLDQLDQDNIGVVADVSGLAAGTHEVALQVSLPRFIALGNSSERLTVTVQVQSPATPVPSKAPETGSAITPEPSSEPAVGTGDATEAPTHSSGAVETTVPTPSPVQSDSAGGNSGTGNGNEITGNAASTGGT